MERIAKSRLTDHLTSNKLLNPHQSSYCKHHSTETALLYIHDHLINAIGSQKLSCLCLRELSAAFDTIDTTSYSLVSPLGSVSMALSSTSLSPTCHLAPSVSDVITLFRPCVPPPVVFSKAPFLVPLLFIMYTTPLSILISSVSLNHHLSQMTPNCFSHFTLPTSTQASTTYKMHFSKSLPG